MTRNREMMKPFQDRGYAVIAANSPGREGQKGRFWSFIPGNQKRRNELAFTHQVLDDAVAKFGIERGQVFLTGFSIGRSLTCYLACQMPTGFATYAPIAGGF